MEKLVRYCKWLLGAEAMCTGISEANAVARHL